MNDSARGTAYQIYSDMRMNSLYHGAQHRVLAGWITAEKIIILVGMTSALGVFKNLIDDTASKGLVLAAAIFTCLVIAGAWEEKTSIHRDLSVRYRQLLHKFQSMGGLDISEADLKIIRSTLAEIEIEEPPSPRYNLLNHCHNQVLAENNEDYRIEHRWIDKFFMYVLDTQDSKSTYAKVNLAS